MHNSPPVRVFVAAGSNLGDRWHFLNRAQDSLARSGGIWVIRTSPVYETEPVGGPCGQDKYLNAVWEIETTLAPDLLHEKLRALEAELGRRRSTANAPRTIDLDILFYGDQTFRRPGLVVPHPRFHERVFVLEPLADLIPQWVPPGFHESVNELLEKQLEKISRS